MKKLKCLLILVLFLALVAVSFADEVEISGNTPSGDFTGSALVVTGAGTLKKVIINNDGTYDVKLELRDSLTAGSGKIVWRGTCEASLGKTCVDNLNGNYETGLYGNVTTTSTTGFYYNMETRAR